MVHYSLTRTFFSLALLLSLSVYAVDRDRSTKPTKKSPAQSQEMIPVEAITNQQPQPALVVASSADEDDDFDGLTDLGPFQESSVFGWGYEPHSLSVIQGLIANKSLRKAVENKAFNGGWSQVGKAAELPASENYIKTELERSTTAAQTYNESQDKAQAAGHAQILLHLLKAIEKESIEMGNEIMQVTIRQALDPLLSDNEISFIKAARQSAQRARHLHTAKQAALQSAKIQHLDNMRPLIDQRHYKTTGDYLRHMAVIADVQDKQSAAAKPKQVTLISDHQSY